jgi:hypothetical protein
LSAFHIGVNKNFLIRKLTTEIARFRSSGAGHCTQLGEFRAVLSRFGVIEGAWTALEQFLV